MAEQVTREQKIQALRQRGILPPNSDIAPTMPDSAGGVPQLTRAQKIEALTKAGVAPPAQAPTFLQEHGLEGAAHGMIDALPAAGAIFGAGLGSAIGGIGSIPGAGVGAVTGNAAKDILNRWVFGEQAKPLGQQVREGVIEADKAMISQKGGELVGQTLKSIAGHFVPPASIKRYEEAADTVMKLKNDTDGNVAQAADQVKEGLQTSLDEFRSNMNTQISTALKDSRATVDTEDILKAVSEAKANLHPKIDQADLAKVGEIEQLVKSLDGYPEAGKMTAQDANALKQKLQDMATAAYRNPGESSGGTKVAEAAKNIAASTRAALNDAVPEIASANNQLSHLHELEDSMNKGLIRTGAAESPLLAAGKYTPGGSSGSARNYEALRKLGEITRQDFISPAQDLAAVQTLGNAKVSLSSPGESIPFAIRKGIDLSKSGFVQTLGQALPQAAGNLTPTVMHGTGAIESLRQLGGPPQ